MRPLDCELQYAKCKLQIERNQNDSSCLWTAAGSFCILQFAIRNFHAESWRATSTGAVDPSLRNAASAFATPNTLYTPGESPGRTLSYTSASSSANRQRRSSHKRTSLPTASCAARIGTPCATQYSISVVAS